MSHVDENPNRDYMLGTGTYELLKKIVQVGLPALATLYFTISQIFDLPYGEEVVATIAAVTTFLGVILTLANRSYNNSEARFDGAVEVLQDEDSQQTLLGFKVNPTGIEHKNEIVLKVNAA